MAPKKQKGPDLKRFMVSSFSCLLFIVVCCRALTLAARTVQQDKRLQFSLNGNRKVIGTLRGYDAFLNVVLEEAEDAAGGKSLGTIVIRGNSIIQFEGLERVAAS